MIDEGEGNEIELLGADEEVDRGGLVVGIAELLLGGDGLAGLDGAGDIDDEASIEELGLADELAAFVILAEAPVVDIDDGEDEEDPANPDNGAPEFDTDADTVAATTSARVGLSVPDPKLDRVANGGEEDKEEDIRSA